MACTIKKTLHASEQDRPDVKVAREAWRQLQEELDPAKLVFIDETGASTNMSRRYGRCPKGQRLICKEPWGHWKTTTFIAGLRMHELAAPMVLDGPMDGSAFLVYVREFLCPTLKPGDVVIADNLQSHKVAGVKEAIEARGATIRYLPPYSPDFNPIEQLFAKLKSILRKAATRTIETLWNAIKNALNHFPPTECAAYLKNSGYSI